MDPAWAHRMLPLYVADALWEPARTRLRKGFAADNSTGNLRVAWNVKEPARVLMRTGSLTDAAVAKDRPEHLVEDQASLKRRGFGGPFSSGRKRSRSSSPPAPPRQVEANNTSIKHIKRAVRGYRYSDNYNSDIVVRNDAWTAV